MYLEPWMIVAFFIVFAAGLLSTYARSYIRGVRTVQKSVDKALLVGFEGMLKGLEEEGIISLAKDKEGKVRAFPGSVDAESLAYWIDQIPDPIIREELLEALSVKL